MKSSPAFYIGTFTIVAGLLAGCGQTGPLFMPKIPGKPVSASKAAKNGLPANATAPAAPDIVPVTGADAPQMADPPQMSPVPSTSTVPSTSPVPAE